MNDEGAWETRGFGGSFSEGTTIGDGSLAVYIGEGAYQGLVAVTEETPIEGTCDVDVRGSIFGGAPVLERYSP